MKCPPTLAALFWGGVSGLGFAPYHVTFLLLISFAWLYKSLFTSAHRFRQGWCFGFGQAFACLYWVYKPLTIHWPRFAALIPAALLLLPGYIGLYAGMVASLQRSFPYWGKGPLLFATQWTLAEWGLGHFLTGFPWTLAGYTWNKPFAILQIAAYGGIYSLSFFTVLLGALLGEAGHRRVSGGGGRPILAAGLLFSVAYGVGFWRLSTVTYQQETTPISMRLVQGNISQEIKWHPALREQHLKTYLHLSRSVAGKVPSIVIWPEAALPFLFTETSGLAEFLGRFLEPGQILITGAMRREKEEERNSLLAIEAAGRVCALYDKQHLLPFGEYVPFGNFLPILCVAQELGLKDSSPGTEEPYWDLPKGFPLTPSICYEIVFPHDFPFAQHRGAWLLNVSNDAWFGDSPEPHQH
ncbi:MAG: apolipoprotein N-acyltransferase, partial [Holosporales bacterium]|nr:apolipoprotein N-acyltransferase [Holosporales bacterium]